jgi:diguanylate cyclase (GGDEF)-like protein
VTADSFLDEDFRVLTSEAFDFVLRNELKRAVRSQNFLTLVHVEPTVQGAPSAGNGERDKAVHEIARLISRDVRETDLLAHTGKGRLSIVLLDADMPNSLAVIERLMARLDHYEFAQPLAIEVGAACCPTHGADVDSLRRAAEARPVHPRRDSRGNASNA